MFSGFLTKQTSISDLTQASDKLFFLGGQRQAGKKQAVFKRFETFYSHTTRVSLFEKEGGERIMNITYSFSPSFLSWLIGVCFFPLGFLIFLIPHKEKGEFEFFLNTHEL